MVKKIFENEQVNWFSFEYRNSYAKYHVFDSKARLF